AARAIGGALAIALAAGQVDVEHVDLVVAGDDPARGVDEERAVSQPLLAFGGTGLAGRIDDQGAEQEPDTELARQLAHAGEERVVGFAPCLVAPALAALDQVARLGGHDEIGAEIARPAHQLADLPQIGLRIGAGGELDAARSKFRAHRAIPSFGSSLPARSSATISSQPPICSPS